MGRLSQSSFLRIRYTRPSHYLTASLFCQIVDITADISVFDHNFWISQSELIQRNDKGSFVSSMCQKVRDIYNRFSKVLHSTPEHKHGLLVLCSFKNTPRRDLCYFNSLIRIKMRDRIFLLDSLPSRYRERSRR